MNGNPMAQNIYDDPAFLTRYRQLPRQVHGLAGAPEWPAMRGLLPDLAGAHVLDLGCGFGWFARWAHQNGAKSVLGLDISTAMITEAQLTNHGDTITYEVADLADLQLTASHYDIVHSSLAFHYVADIDSLAGSIANACRPGARLVFSVEHPIFSAPSSQQFETSDAGNTIWPLEHYLTEGERTTSWIVDGVRKHHRTIGTHLNALIDAGFAVRRVIEWGPSDDEVEKDPNLIVDRHRPWFLLIAAERGR